MAEGISGAERAAQNAHMQMLLDKPATSDAKKAAIKKGDIDFQQESVRLSSSKHIKSEVLNDLNKAGQQAKPSLASPDDLSPNQMTNASKTLATLSKSTDEAMESTKQLFSDVLNGTVTKAEAAKLKSQAAILDDTASHLQFLSGKGVETAEGRRQVLAGMGGFQKFQLDNLEQQSNAKDIQTYLANQHGGAKGLDQKTAILRSLGFSDSQIKTMMSLAPPDTDGSRLDMMRSAGSDVKAVLQALGFGTDAAKGLTALLTGKYAQLGSAEQKQLLAKMGFSQQEIDVILLASNPASLKNQAVLMRNAPQGLSQFLMMSSKGMNLLAAGQSFEDMKMLEQLVDIFAVMELLFKMSANQRASARETRATEYEAAKNEILNQAEEMKSAALMTAIGGWVSAGTKIVSGGIQVGMSVKAGGLDQGSMQRQVAVANGISQVTSASGDAIKAGTDYQAGMHQAQVKVHEAAQKTRDNAAQSATEFMNLHQDMVKTVISKMDEIIRSWFETLKSTTRA
ncbi:hypothetical protein [Endozoicomonas sp. SCSIO W0465]|uniref:hypothetical protein n=1 Tax=Endozoicomonas sp. SCSIO W0465 TaxID=2918516 RepID=UPI002075D583|nr:hypothetical protein [Endozoicomonas sp. SCSIO W0465]USE35285.1 hypothetical protein MJO57_24775 [Endozoicomonas sp. SCSIO W0465]